MKLLRAPASGARSRARVEQLPEPLGRAEPAHPAQHRLGRVLERQVEVRRDAGRGRRSPRPGRAGSRPAAGRTTRTRTMPSTAASCGSSFSSRRGSPEILAVRRRVLADQHQLAYAVARPATRPRPAAPPAYARRTRRGTTGSRRTSSAGRSRWPASARRPGPGQPLAEDRPAGAPACAVDNQTRSLPWPGTETVPRGGRPA